MCGTDWEVLIKKYGIPLYNSNVQTMIKILENRIEVLKFEYNKELVTFLETKTSKCRGFISCSTENNLSL